ncbi:MAG: YbaB/EbfC family nucleoid-associated protein [Christensenellaceae bacterium]|nr:YbaB/EbfC family nucleoid-associated protein [Christensenellaceae bacterium]
MNKFNMNGANMQQLMRQAETAKQQIEKTKAELAETAVEASAGGGMVSASMSGAYELLDLHIKKEVVDPDDVETIEDLVIAVINECLRQVGELRNEKLPI